MTKNFLQNLNLLTKNMIDELPICDIHVHLPGVISPQIAWDLGVRNKFISVIKEKNGKYVYSSGPLSLSVLDPHEHYIDIFKSGFLLDKNGKEKLGGNNERPINSDKEEIDESGFWLGHDPRYYNVNSIGKVTQAKADVVSMDMRGLGKTWSHFIYLELPNSKLMFSGSD